PLRSHSSASCRSTRRALRTTQFAKLVKFSYLWLWQSFSYIGGPMASRFPRELTIRQLRALAAVHRDRSVTAAAKHLHLTQPAVTRPSRNLPERAGLPLTQRTSHGMRLTDAGREVLSLSERIEAAIADCETSLEMMAGKTAGRISIGAVSTAKYFVPFMISGLSKLYTNVEIMLSIGNRQDGGAALRGSDLDIALQGHHSSTINS